MLIVPQNSLRRRRKKRHVAMQSSFNMWSQNKRRGLDLLHKDHSLQHESASLREEAILSWTSERIIGLVLVPMTKAERAGTKSSY